MITRTFIVCYKTLLLQSLVFLIGTIRQFFCYNNQCYLFFAHRLGSVTNIRLEPPASTYIAGQTVRCIADGFPSAEYRWIRLPDNVEVSAKDTLNVNESSGNYSYMCVSWNHVNGKTASVYSQQVYFRGRSTKTI